MSIFSKIAFIIVLSLAGKSALAANDWTVPCTNGRCSYDLPSHSSASAKVQVWGSPNAISDITEAAGWKILDCDAKSKNQTIRMVCTSSSAPCDHVLQDGAVHKLVRMPENCGPMPFARVADYAIAEDQTIPDSLKRSLFGRGSPSQPTVHSMTLDTNFAAVNATQTGDVSFSVQGINVPGENGNFDLTPPAQKRRFVSRPVLAESQHVHPRNWIDDLQGKFNKTDTKNLPAVYVDKQANIMNANVDCPDLKASLQASIDTKAHAQISLGVIAAGTAIPPKLSEFGILVGYTGDIDASLTFNASAGGSFDSGAIPIFSTGIPGLEIPGILTVGPEFTVSARVNGDIELDLDFTVDLSYKIDNAKLQFPPNTGGSGGSFSRNEQNFALSADPNFSGNAHLVAHLIPEIAIGIQALEGVASTTIYLDLDASATVDLQGATGASGSKGSDGGKGQGCVDLTANLDVYAGAKASFFHLFKENTKVSLYNKDFNLYEKCFDTAAKSSSSSIASLTASSTASSSTVTAINSATNATISSSINTTVTSGTVWNTTPIASSTVTANASAATVTYANVSFTTSLSSNNSGVIAIASPTTGIYSTNTSSTAISYGTPTGSASASPATLPSDGASSTAPVHPLSTGSCSTKRSVPKPVPKKHTKRATLTCPSISVIAKSVLSQLIPAGQ